MVLSKFQTQAVLDKTRKAWREKFSIELIFHLIAERQGIVSGLSGVLAPAAKTKKERLIASYDDR